MAAGTGDLRPNWLTYRSLRLYDLIVIFRKLSRPKLSTRPSGGAFLVLDDLLGLPLPSLPVATSISNVGISGILIITAKFGFVL